MTSISALAALPAPLQRDIAFMVGEPAVISRVSKEMNTNLKDASFRGLWLKYQRAPEITDDVQAVSLTQNLSTNEERVRAIYLRIVARARIAPIVLPSPCTLQHICNLARLESAIVLCKFFEGFCQHVQGPIRQTLPSNLPKNNSFAKAVAIRSWMQNHLEQLTAINDLYLTECNLVRLPSEIGLFRNLNRLWLAHNELTTLPAEIGQCTALVYLDLQNTGLTLTKEEVRGLFPAGQKITINLTKSFNAQRKELLSSNLRGAPQR